MWIRSQDKETLTDVKHLSIRYLNGCYSIFTDNHLAPNEICNLAIYKTKEKALEVLDTIHFYLNKGYTEMTVNTQEKYIKEQRYFNVFLMPQDDEVIIYD